MLQTSTSSPVRLFPMVAQAFRQQTGNRAVRVVLPPCMEGDARFKVSGVILRCGCMLLVVTTPRVVRPKHVFLHGAIIALMQFHLEYEERRWVPPISSALGDIAVVAEWGDVGFRVGDTLAYIWRALPSRSPRDDVQRYTLRPICACVCHVPWYLRHCVSTCDAYARAYCLQWFEAMRCCASRPPRYRVHRVALAITCTEHYHCACS